MSSRFVIKASERFLRAQDGLGPGLQGKVIGAVHDFARKYETMPSMASRGVVLAHMMSPAGQLLEIDVTRKDRLVALWASPTLTLLDVGTKEVVPDYSPSKLATDLANAEKAPKGFDPSDHVTGALFEDEDSRNWESFAGEETSGWLYYLTPAQSAIVNTIRTRLARVVEDPNRYFIVGGPGTGKTSVLLSLLVELTSAGRSVRLQVSDGLANDIETCGIRIEAFRPKAGMYQFLDTGVDVLLVDDPGDQLQIQTALTNAYGQARCVVVAFDPCQLDTDLTDEAYEALVKTNGVTSYTLRDCYRQKSVVGRAAKRVIDRVAESSPYLADGKKKVFRETHRQVYTLANEFRFVNGGGVTQVWQDADLTSVKQVAERIQSRRAWGMKVAPILVVVDDFTEAREWIWKGRFGGRAFQVIRLAELGTVKGLEYQWVVLVIRASLYQDLQEGFAGSSNRIYQARRMLRIPFTRARDGILTMVLPDVERPGLADAYRWS